MQRENAMAALKCLFVKGNWAGVAGAWLLGLSKKKQDIT